MFYIEAFLARDFYGEMRITVIHAQTLFQTKICHSNTIHLADMVVFRTRLNHYFPASKGLILSFFVIFSCTMLIPTGTMLVFCHAVLDISVQCWFTTFNMLFSLFYPFQSKSQLSQMRLERLILKGTWSPQLH